MKIIQIGANKGNDHVTDFVKTVGVNDIELLLLVEPIKMVLGEITSCYSFMGSKAIVEQTAIVADAGKKEVEMFYAPICVGTETSPSYELSSLNRNHLNGHVSGDMTKVESFMVPCMTINQLLDKYNLINVDYLFVDAEGMDAEIVKSLDLTKYKVQNIQIEKIHGGDSVTDYLLENGYVERTSLDTSGRDKLFYKEVLMKSY